MIQVLIGFLSATVGLVVGILGSRTAVKVAEKNLRAAEMQISFNMAVKIADFRQQWINDLRETMAKWQSFPVFSREDETLKEKEESAQEFSRLRAKVFLLMDRKDAHYDELKSLLCSPEMMIVRDSRTETYSDPFIVLCQNILKTEWEKLKQDLVIAARVSKDE